MRHFIALILLVAILGCNKKEHKNSDMIVTPEPDKSIAVNFAGYDRGCREFYNPIFCADKYKPKTSLQAGVGGKDDFTIYIKDSKGKIIVLDKNQTRFLLGLKHKDK